MVRSAVKSYLTSRCIQNLSELALNRLTILTSTASPSINTLVSTLLIFLKVQCPFFVQYYFVTSYYGDLLRVKDGKDSY